MPLNSIQVARYRLADHNPRRTIAGRSIERKQPRVAATIDHQVRCKIGGYMVDVSDRKFVNAQVIAVHIVHADEYRIRTALALVPDREVAIVNERPEKAEAQRSQTWARTS